MDKRRGRAPHSGLRSPQTRDLRDVPGDVQPLSPLGDRLAGPQSRRAAALDDRCRSGTSPCRRRAGRVSALPPTPIRSTMPEIRSGHHAERLGREPPQGGSLASGARLRHRAGGGAALPAAARSGIRLSRDRLFRIDRQLLRLRAFRTGQAIGLLSGRARRDVRARDPGGMPPHPVLRQLAGVAPRQPQLVASHPLRAACRGGLGLHRRAAHRTCAQRGHQHEGHAAGKQLHGQRRAGGDGRRDRLPRSHAGLPAGERPATGRIRSAAVPADPRSGAGAVCARHRQALAAARSAKPCAADCRRIAKSPDIVILRPTSRRRRYRQ